MKFSTCITRLFLKTGRKFELERFFLEGTDKIGGIRKSSNVCYNLEPSLNA